MNYRPAGAWTRLLLAGVLVWLYPGLAFGHVGWQAPAQNAHLRAGSQAELSWVDVIPHATVGYLIEFYSAPDADVEVVGYVDAPQHSLTWQVPAEPCAACSLVVTQVNEVGEYNATVPIHIDASDAPSGPSTVPLASDDAVPQDAFTDPPRKAPASCSLTYSDSAVAAKAWIALACLAMGFVVRQRARRATETVE